MFTVTSNDVLLDTTNSTLSLDLQATLSDLKGAHGELSTTVLGQPTPLLPVLVADGANAQSIGLGKAYDSSNFHGDFNVGLSGGNVSAVNTLESNSKALEAGSAVTFANGNADINLALALDPKAFANNDTFPSIGTDLAINWTFPNGTVANTQLPGDGAGPGNLPSVAFNDFQITNVQTYLDNLLKPMLQPVIQYVIPPMEEVLGFLTAKLPIINKSIPDLLGVTWNNSLADELQTALDDIKNYQQHIHNLSEALVFGSFGLVNVGL